MNWKYHIPHIWPTPTKTWEDIWLWPVDHQIQGNMGGKINLDICSVESLLTENDESSLEVARALMATGEPYWFWPYPVADWGDEVSMVANCVDFDKEEFKRYAKIYLEQMGYEVTTLTEASTDETFTEVDR